MGRMHGGCALAGNSETGPYFEAARGSGRGPADGTCGTGPDAGFGPNTVSSGFDGPWTRTPSRWNHHYFSATLEEEWEPVKSTFGNDQWWTIDRNSKYARVRRLTADMSMKADEIYRAIAEDF